MNRLPPETLHFILEYMTEKDQLNFAFTCKRLYRVFRIYHVGYASPRWVPVNINSNTSAVTQVDPFNHESTSIPTVNIPNAPPAANYRDGVLLDGKLYLIILEEESPICWILDFDERIPLNWRRVKVTFAESESKEDIEFSEDSADDKKSDIDAKPETPQKSKYNPLRSTVAAAISPMIYLFGGECLTTGKPSGTLYELNTRDMVLREVVEQVGDLPPARKMHSLNVIDDQCLVLFGGRCLMNNSDHPREYDTKDFYIYDILTKTWTLYRKHVPYPRSFHSTTVIEYKLYLYGGQQITSSSTPDSRIHDDDDLWCFTFNLPQQEDSADEGHNTPASSSSRGSNRSVASRISTSFQQEKWQKLFSPRNFTSHAFSSGIGGEWHTTTGNNVGRRCGAAMFSVGKRVAVLGGYERDNWKWSVSGSKKGMYKREEIRDLGKINERSREYSEGTVRKDEYRGSRSNNESQEPNPWELCKLYLPDRKRWDQVRIDGFPEMECVAITKDHTNRPFDVFVMGRKRGDTEDQGIITGWIREEYLNN